MCWSKRRHQVLPNCKKQGTQTRTLSCTTKGVVKFTGTDAMAGMAESFDDLLKNRNSGHASYEIGCERLETILEHAGVTKIDLWSLDVEGAEIHVLESMNWEIPVVHVLIIERNPGRRAIERLLTKKGFTYVREQRGILAYTVQLVVMLQYQRNFYF